MDYRASDTFPSLTVLDGGSGGSSAAGPLLVGYRVLLVAWFVGALVPLGKLLLVFSSAGWWRWLTIDLAMGSLSADLGPPMILLAELAVDVTVLAATGAALLFVGRYLRS